MRAVALSADATAAVGRLRPAGDLQDDDRSGGVVNRVDHAQVADAQPPELRPDQFRDARGMRIQGQREDRPAQSSGIARGQSTKITLSSRGKLDAQASFAHVSSVA